MKVVRTIPFVARLLGIRMIERTVSCSTSYFIEAAVEGSQTKKIKLVVMLQIIHQPLQVVR